METPAGVDFKWAHEVRPRCLLDTKVARISYYRGVNGSEDNIARDHIFKMYIIFLIRLPLLYSFLSNITICAKHQF